MPARLCVTSLGRALVVAVLKNVSKESTKAVSANHFDILLVLLSFRPVSSYNASAIPAPGSGSIKAPQLGSDLSAQSGTEKKKGLAHWNQCNLTVQCTDSMCQISMGTFLVADSTDMCRHRQHAMCCSSTKRAERAAQDLIP